MLCDQDYGEVVESTNSLTCRSLRLIPGDSTNSEKQPVFLGGIDCSAVSSKKTTVLTMLSPLATPTVVNGAETLSSCQIPPDQLQRSWFGVKPAMSKPFVLTDPLPPLQWVNRFSSQAVTTRVPACLAEVPRLVCKVKPTPVSLRH